MNRQPLIVVVGAGSFGTALGNVLSRNENIKVQLLSIEEDVVKSINETGVNQTYFPNIQLNRNLSATTDKDILRQAAAILFVVPSSIAVQYISSIKDCIPENAILINCAKGFGKNDIIISDFLSETFVNDVAALKGPSFSIEVINNMPTGYTFACKKREPFDTFIKYAKNTNMKFDYTTDMLSVELLSIMKNVYAIILGIVDAHLGSINARFLVFTNVIHEMRKALIVFGGNDDTFFNYCGIGDFGLTALNDLSRNRTMGLFIGKGFIPDIESNNVTLEGQHSLNILYSKLKEKQQNKSTSKDFPILFELYKLMNTRSYDRRTFIYNIINNKRR